MTEQNTFGFDAFIFLGNELIFHDDYHRGQNLANLFEGSMNTLTPKARFAARGLYYMAGTTSGSDSRSIMTMLYIENMIECNMSVSRDAEILDGTYLDAYDCYNLPEGVKVIKVSAEDLNEDCESLVMSEEVPAEWADTDDRHFTDLVIRCVVRCALGKMGELGIDTGFIA